MFKHLVAICALVSIAAASAVLVDEKNEFKELIEELKKNELLLLSMSLGPYEKLYEQVLVEDERIAFKFSSEEIHDMIVRDITSRFRGILRPKVKNIDEYALRQRKACSEYLPVHSLLLKKAANSIVTDCALLTKKGRKILAQAKTCKILLSDEGNAIYERAGTRLTEKKSSSSE